MSIKTVAKTSLAISAMALTMVQFQSVLVNQARGQAPLTAPLTNFVTPTPTVAPLTAPVQSTPTPTVQPTSAPSNNNGGGNNGGSNNGGGNSGGGGGSSNGGGSNNGGGNVCRDARPNSAPIILSARATGANQVTVTWKSGWAPFNGFVISYGTKRGITQFTTDAQGAKTTSAIVKGLNGNTTYYFRIQAKNGCVAGDYSRELSVRTSGSVLSAKTIKKAVLTSTKKQINVVKPVIIKKKK